MGFFGRKEDECILTWLDIVVIWWIFGGTSNPEFSLTAIVIKCLGGWVFFKLGISGILCAWNTSDDEHDYTQALDLVQYSNILLVMEMREEGWRHANRRSEIQVSSSLLYSLSLSLPYLTYIHISSLHCRMSELSITTTPQYPCSPNSI